MPHAQGAFRNTGPAESVGSRGGTIHRASAGRPNRTGGRSPPGDISRRWPRPSEHSSVLGRVNLAICPIRRSPSFPTTPPGIQRFEEERALLEEALAPWLAGGIHHIGSTAIPGLSAKPIIDMMAGVRDLAEARAAYEPLRALSYINTPHRPSIAHHFSKPSARIGETTHGLHLTEPASDLWRERLAFRDVLRNDAALASDYGNLKSRLAQEHQGDLDSYTAGKRKFVSRVLAGRGLQFGKR